MSRFTSVKSSLPKLKQAVFSPEMALRSVTSKDGLGVYASSDRLFKGAVFGRDSLEVAEDLMTVKPRLVRRILLTMASLQGEHGYPESEEEPGKIIHEYRTRLIGGRPIDRFSQQIFDSLSARWGGNDGELSYYGSIDSTPLFIRTLATYCDHYGTAILNSRVRLRSGRQESMVNILDRACAWLINKLSASNSGLLEYKRLNPHGIENQVWKDSLEFYTHRNGFLANHDQPIATVEVQAIAHDALKMVARLLPSWRLERKADRLRAQTINRLWLKDSGYFALGLDYDERKRQRLITVLTANPAEMLDSGFFDGLPEEQKRKMLTDIIRRIMSEDFLTDAGIRSRALREAGIVGHWDYHGAYTTWPKETFDIAKGLRRQGFPRLARELDNRIVNSVRAARSFPEFFFVDRRGRVLGVARPAKTHGELVLIDSRNHPEKTQAWTVSAVIAISSYYRRSLDAPKQSDWQIELEKEILADIPHMPFMRSRRRLSARYPFYPYELQLHEGQR